MNPLSVGFIQKANESELAEVYFQLKELAQQHHLGVSVNELNLRTALDKRMSAIGEQFQQMIEQQIDNLEGMVTRKVNSFFFQGVTFKLKATLTPTFVSEQKLYTLRKKITVDYFNHTHSFIYTGEKTVPEILQYLMKNLSKIQKEINQQEEQKKKVIEQAEKEKRLEEKINELGLEIKKNSIVINLKKSPFKENQEKTLQLIEDMIKTLKGEQR